MSVRPPICGLASKVFRKIGIVRRPPFTIKTRRGNVALVLFPNSDLRTAKRRPVLVLQREDLGTRLSQTIVAMISSNPARADHPSRVAIPLGSNAGKSTGLRLDSWVMTDNLATVLDSEIDLVLGRMPDMAAVETPLKHTLAL